MPRTSRRRLLAGIGVLLGSSVAGCSRLGGESDSLPRFEPSSIETILSETIPDVERPTPVQPAATAVEDGIDRYDELLETIPSTLSTDDVPNEVVRQEIEAARDEAKEHRNAVEAAADRFRALQSLQSARESAREAAAGYTAVRNDITGDVETERGSVRTTVGTRLVTVEYTGENAARTLLLTARVENELVNARRRLRRGFRTDNPNALDIGNLAGTIEGAHATLDTINALTDRHAETVTDGTDFRNSFEAAIESSIRSFQRREVPKENTTPEDLVGDEADRLEVELLLGNALRAVGTPADRIQTSLEEERLGVGLDDVFVLERDIRALDATVQRVTDGEFPAPDTVDRVRAEREAAIEAADAVPVSANERSLAGDVFVRTLQQLQWIDRGVERHVERDRDASLPQEYARYALTRARLKALPDAIDAVRARADVL